MLTDTLRSRIKSFVLPVAFICFASVALSHATPTGLSAQDDEFDFTLNQAFMNKLDQDDTLLQTMRLRMGEHSNVHPLGNDCEMHIAGNPVDVSPGRPAAFVVEPPNLCKFNRNGSPRPPATTNWANLASTKIKNKTCEVKGFLRLFTEHATGGSSSSGSNPNHVLEFHPATEIICGTDTFSFIKMLNAPKGLRAIKPATANSCIRGRQLEVRFRNNRYEFKESGGGSCGNFAIVEISSLDQNWVRDTSGGHSAIARISADGQSIATLKLYTLSGSAADEMMEGIQQNGLGDARKMVHGIFTYDFKSIIQTLKGTGSTLRNEPTDWTVVKFPLALVVFGETPTVPWEEN